MAAIPADAVPKLRSNARAEVRRSILHHWLAPAALLMPSLLFLALFFALPALGLISYSFLTQAGDGTTGLPLTLEHYRHFFATPLYLQVLATPLYLQVLLTTLKISLVTTAVAVILA